MGEIYNKTIGEFLKNYSTDGDLAKSAWEGYVAEKKKKNCWIIYSSDDSYISLCKKAKQFGKNYFQFSNFPGFDQYSTMKCKIQDQNIRISDIKKIVAENMHVTAEKIIVSYGLVLRDTDDLCTRVNWTPKLGGFISLSYSK